MTNENGNKKITERNTVEIERIIIQPTPKTRSHIVTIVSVIACRVELRSNQTKCNN
jgi:hypothetical protein